MRNRKPTKHGPLNLEVRLIGSVSIHLGYIVVSTNDGLYGVNPNDGKILWENKSFPAVNSSNYQEINGTEFITIAYATKLGAKDSDAGYHRSCRWKSFIRLAKGKNWSIEPSRSSCFIQAISYWCKAKHTDGIAFYV